MSAQLPCPYTDRCGCLGACKYGLSSKGAGSADSEACYCQVGVVCPACERQANDDRKRLVRELDVALNGEAGAAPQASLCDIVAQVKAETRKRGVPVLAKLEQRPAPVVDLDATQKHIEWVHATLRENGCCIDGGKCHHRCDPKGECFRQRGCVPLSGSRLGDDWKLPAHQPAPVVDDAMVELIEAAEHGRDQLQRALEIDQECTCEPCPQCSRDPIRCSETQCAETCDCILCDHCCFQGGIDGLTAAIYRARETQP